MSTLGVVQLLFFALAVVMAGLGLSLRVQDFRRLGERKREVVLTLLLQMVVLPVVALGIVYAFGLTGLMAAGVMLLAATPGSISANLYSHLFGGNVAFNVALTGLNTFLCAMTLPLLTGWAIEHFTGRVQFVPAMFEKALETIGIVVVPTAVGMFIAAKMPRRAAFLSTPVKVLSAVLVVVFSLIAIVKEWQALFDSFSQIGPAILAFNFLSVAIGAGVGKMVASNQTDARTIAFQVSIHNAILAIYVAMAVVNEPLLALPAALYSITMNFFALGFGALALRGWTQKRRALASNAAPARSSA